MRTPSLNPRLRPRNLGFSLLFLAACTHTPSPPSPPCEPVPAFPSQQKPDWWDRECPGIPFNPNQQIVLPQ